MSQNDRSEQPKGFADRTFEGGLPTMLGCLAIPVVGIVGAILALSQCSKTDTVASATTAAPAEQTTSPSYTADERSMICRAGVAAVFGRDPKTMTVRDLGGDVTRVEYRRPDDHKVWKSDCRIDDDRIVWRGVDAFGDNGPGRWRNGPDDETLTFKIDGRAVTTASSDGSSASETYNF
jgi:hypothetical protein